MHRLFIIGTLNSKLVPYNSCEKGIAMIVEYVEREFKNF